ncbi:MAG: AAA family ATPase [Acidimicrobiia bacterium]|nr:AAA family ATPase [Acidimicrobiia bacterium]
MTVFDDVVGHTAVTSVLEREADHPAQAYLFVGPASVGKATVARRFAARLLCGGDEDGIRRVLAGLHPDLHVVEPDGRTALTVDQARTTAARAVLAPVEADRKLFLFEEAGMMNDEAANALLKTLEEPTGTTVFLLVAESEDDLPATVASRCRTVFFGRVTEEEVVASLVGAGVTDAQAARAASTSGGRPGLARMLATRPEVAAFRSAWLDVPSRLSDAPGDAFRLAEELVAATEPLLEALAERQANELSAVEDEPAAAKAVKDRHDRERRRADRALHVTGLEILASWYRDAAAAQFGAPVRNRDVAGTALADVRPALAVARATRVLDTVDSLEANQRPDLAFAALFSDLAAHG